MKEKTSAERRPLKNLFPFIALFGVCLGALGYFHFLRPVRHSPKQDAAPPRATSVPRERTQTPLLTPPAETRRTQPPLTEAAEAPQGERSDAENTAKAVATPPQNARSPFMDVKKFNHLLQALPHSVREKWVQQSIEGKVGYLADAELLKSLSLKEQLAFLKFKKALLDNSPAPFPPELFKGQEVPKLLRPETAKTHIWKRYLEKLAENGYTPPIDLSLQKDP